MEFTLGSRSIHGPGIGWQHQIEGHSSLSGVIGIDEPGASMADTKPRYRAFLLRLWQERSGGEWVWRASLEDPHSHVRTGFPDLKQLCAFLKELAQDRPMDPE